MYEIEQIKDNQCTYCGKRGKKNCNMNIRDEKCINYMGRN